MLRYYILCDWVFGCKKSLRKNVAVFQEMLFTTLHLRQNDLIFFIETDAKASLCMHVHASKRILLGNVICHYNFLSLEKIKISLSFSLLSLY